MAFEEQDTETAEIAKTVFIIGTYHSNLDHTLLKALTPRESQ